MTRTIKVLSAALLCALVFTQSEVCTHNVFGHQAVHVVGTVEESNDAQVLAVSETANERPDHFTKDTLYRWIDSYGDWVMIENTNEVLAELANESAPDYGKKGTIQLEWDVLMNILYELKYFKQMDMKIFAPVFRKAQKALHKREVIIEGYVIPFDETEGLLSLSFNPYASCFFCGKASPASVISMYMRDEDARYRMDDRKTFRGTLYLNSDDPNDFYYILRDAREE